MHLDFISKQTATTTLTKTNNFFPLRETVG